MIDEQDIDTSGTAFLSGGAFGSDSRTDRKSRERATIQTPAERRKAKPREPRDKSVSFRTTNTFRASLARWAKAAGVPTARFIEAAVLDYVKRKGLK